MERQRYVVLLLLLCSFLLSSCMTGVWTGANLLYNRHNVYKKFNDYQLFIDANHALTKDKFLKQNDCKVEIAVFNGDILLVGHVATAELRREVNARIAALSGYRRVFNQVSIRSDANNTVQDTWITGEIRGHILADSYIEPTKFKVVTSEQIVYLMGDVIPDQAERVITIARQCAGVKRVVKLFKYYNLSDNAQA